MRPEIPLEVLSLVGPILSWADGTHSDSVPWAWGPDLAEDPAGVPGADLAESAAAGLGQERAWLLKELPNHSLDTVDELIQRSREKTLPLPPPGRFTPPRRRVAPPRHFDLWHVLEKLSKRYLIWNGGKVAIKTGRMVELHELGLRMPLGFLVRHFHARAVAAGEQSLSDVADLPEAVSLLPSNAQGLRAVVRRGLTEGHLHLNSVHATEIAWADHLLSPARFRPRRFSAPEWRLLRLARAAARLLALATTLIRAGTTLLDPRLAAEVCENSGHPRPSPPRPSHLQHLIDGFDAMYFASTENLLAQQEKRFRKAFLEIVDHLTPAEVELADRWESVRRRRGATFTVGSKLQLLHWLDPDRTTHLWFGSAARGYHGLKSSFEKEKALASLHLASHLALMRLPRQESGIHPTPRGHFLHQILYRYLVCKTHHWQLGVQQGRTTGLRQFEKYYTSNQRWPLRSTSQELADAVLRRARDWRGLRVLEGRIGPPRHSRELHPWLSAFASRGKERRVEKLGLVVHFIKEPERPQHTEVGISRARFARLRSTYRRQAFDLFRILEQPSLVTPFIVGIDAANLELSTPPEVFAPVFRFLRDRPIALSKGDFLDLEAWQVQSGIREIVEQRRLGMTFHVGEEFRHLLSGLRAISEVLEFLAPLSGDRIGHGIALGIDPRVWMDHVGRQALVSRQEWLDTLVWLHRTLGTGHHALRKLKIEEEIERLGRQLYLGEDVDSRRSVTPLLFRNVWRLRQLDPEMIDLHPGGKIEFKCLAGDDSATWRWNSVVKAMVDEVTEEIGKNPPTDLLSRYWFSPRTRREGAEMELIDMEKDVDLWLEACVEAQKAMQKEVAARHIAVEVNPSANRIIGPLGRYADHHVFKLTLDDDQRWKRWLRVTVNTDNPGTANTCLTHEFYLLGEALIDSGVPEVEVEEWLEWLRQSGEDGSFVRQLPRPDSRVMTRLLGRLRATRQPLRRLREPDAIVRELWKQWPRKSRSVRAG